MLKRVKGKRTAFAFAGEFTKLNLRRISRQWRSNWHSTAIPNWLALGSRRCRSGSSMLPRGKRPLSVQNDRRLSLLQGPPAAPQLISCLIDRAGGQRDTQKGVLSRLKLLWVCRRS